MKKTIQLLKDKGIIEKIQKNFNQIKPPKGTSDEQLNESIEFILHIEATRNEEFEDALIAALFEDAVEAIRSELNIEFCEKHEFAEQAKARLLEFVDELFKKGHGEE